MPSVSDHEGEIGGEGDQEETRGVEGSSPYAVSGGGGGKQPNFLQKLYDFMALDPHPCPDVIYWAADSKQLVIAQPERLAREVLPKLFKHDKLSSFGRQLNIYGFSRMFPGRQFKGPDGSISDASVWSHPTLHRSSTMSDVTSIKRRAAPKLFRTRRLANGQVIRTRAGPGVQAKFHEVRDEMAETRRSRVGQTSGDPRSSRSYAFDENEGPEGESPRHRSLSLRAQPTDHTHTQSPHHPTQAQRMTVTPHRPGVHEQLSPPRTQFWDRGRDHPEPQIQPQQSAGQQPSAHSLALECIQEGIASSWGSSFEFPPIHSLPVTSALYRQGQGTASFSAATPHIPYTTQGTAHAYSNNNNNTGMVHQPNQSQNQSQIVAAQLNNMGMAIQSCPASIHTSPVLRPASIPQSYPALHDPFDLLPSFIPSPLFGTHHQHQHQQLPPIITTQPNSTEYALHSAPPPLRITDPAAIDPFGFNFPAIHCQSNPTTGTGTGMMPSARTHAHHRDSVASALSALSNLSPPSSVTDQQSVLEWRGGTIDPRWVSPGGSAWTTPAVTPRSGSPINGPVGPFSASVSGLITPNTYPL